MAALGVQNMFLPTSYGGAITEWVQVWVIKVHTYDLRYYFALASS